MRGPFARGENYLQIKGFMVPYRPGFAYRQFAFQVPDLTKFPPCEAARNSLSAATGAVAAISSGGAV
tara:strand:+ start:2620 stop:2820 length:201 start_codon:yes stop_codon:yes gene_type:complete